ncbi:hypothetical protein NZD85_00045 [Empedobacter stercoris]|uniref:Lipoprotein n=1 Tax=Empedobacter falsenii TaxID=343874 RepID=A0ABY8VCG0_9FLAO|nr:MULTISPECIES: hypothetical protein [Empedobacter]UWX67033.1 hypothetical protein NZD85_00045 [Empedobacter stercoris]WIH97210.1 hypothetical protein OBA43_13425 [Empedobacter falsenii]HJD86282.1 hypothetical protein [Empedobacter falsenii]
MKIFFSKYIQFGILIMIILFFISCDNCERFYDDINNLESNIIVTKNLTKEQSFPKVFIEGLSLKTKNKEILSTENRSLIGISKYIKIGDTVIKKKGEPIMYVYKKDSIIIRSFENFCNKELYNKNFEAFKFIKR